MFKNFEQIERHVTDLSIKKRIVLAGSHDMDALSAVVFAKRRGIADGILVGRISETENLLKELGESSSDYLLVDETDDTAIVETACRMVTAGDADIPMKGLVQTAAFMRGILNKTRGFVPPKGLLSQALVYENTREMRLMILTDCAINIAPDYNDKVSIIKNAVKLAHILGNPCPKVAVLAPLEVINPNMQSTIDAAMLSKAAERGQINGCIIDGPLALDNAISVEAADHKGLKSQVAGYADILVAPDLAAGNIFAKSLTYYAGLKTAGTVNGTNTPVVMTSRTDSVADKLNSILLAIMQSA